MFKPGDYVTTNGGVSSNYRLPMTGSLVLAHREIAGWCLILVPRKNLYCEQRLCSLIVSYDDIVWLDEIKVINPECQVMWYSDSFLKKLINIIMPNGETITFDIVPRLGNNFSFQSLKYEITEMSEDKELIWAERCEERSYV